MRTPGTGTTSDALVVGAGPTGLLLAGDLAAAGHSVTVLERRTEGIGNLTRAFGVHARTLEQFDARGLADELAGTGLRTQRLQLFGRLSLDLSRLPTRFPYLLITPQYEVERLLERRARELGAEFRYDTEVTGLRQGPDGVELTAGPATHRATYAVGADGHRSTVRGAIGLPFPGRSVIRSMVLADVRLDRGPESRLALNGVGDAFAFVVPFGDGWYRVGGWDRRRQVPDDAPLDLDEVREIARRALGDDFGMRDARWLSRFHSDERQAPAYRVGRVLLAGDAAHVHSPAGGQGMNTGLQDAANLGWKLAAVLRGGAPGGLLDSYEAERHPVGRTVLRSSGALLRLAMADRPAELALRRLVTLAGRVPPVSDRALGSITGLGISYGAERGAHPLVGRRAPDVRLAPSGGPARLYEALRGGRFVLIAPPGAGAAAEGREDRVRRAGWASDRRTTLLVRPDGYVAWAADAPDPASLRTALRYWLGDA